MVNILPFNFVNHNFSRLGCIFHFLNFITFKLLVPVCDTHGLFQGFLHMFSSMKFLKTRVLWMSMHLNQKKVKLFQIT